MQLATEKKKKEKQKRQKWEHLPGHNTKRNSDVCWKPKLADKITMTYQKDGKNIYMRAEWVRSSDRRWHRIIHLPGEG
jgi:hypothetical protein